MSVNYRLKFKSYTFLFYPACNFNYKLKLSFKIKNLTCRSVSHIYEHLRFEKKTSDNNLLMFIISSTIIELIDNSKMIEDNKDND